MILIILFDNHNNQSHLASSTSIVPVKFCYWFATKKYLFLVSRKKMLNKLTVKKHFKRLKYLPLIAHSSPRMRGYMFTLPYLKRNILIFGRNRHFFFLDKKMGAFCDYHKSKETFLNPHSKMHDRLSIKTWVS